MNIDLDMACSFIFNISETGSDSFIRGEVGKVSAQLAPLEMAGLKTVTN
jgi:hypothetical protein